MQTRKYDVVIVGSGAGGGTVAKALSDLCSQGKKIALLEWGGRFSASDNTRREVEMASKYYFDNGGFQTSTQDMTLAFAAGVGGSTNVYTGVTFRLPETVLRDKWQLDIPYADLEQRMARYERENNVHLQPEENINRNNLLFRAGCESLGWDVGQFPLNIKDCAGLNTCNMGCARSAKQGTAVVQIPVAEANGVEVVPFCRVDRIEEGAVIAEVVPPAHGLAASHWDTGAYRIEASQIVLAAGTMNTPPILMRSFGDDLSPVLGRYFTCHPALTLVAEHDEIVDGTIGHPKSYYCDRFVKDQHFLLETCMYFPFVTAKNLSGFGKDVDELIGRFPYLQMILVLVLDEALAHNRIAIDKRGNPVAHYEIGPALVRSMVQSMVASGQLFFAAGARRVHLPAMQEFFVYRDQVDKLADLVREDLFKLGKVSIAAAHLMGGCRMGQDVRTSVTDLWGRVYGVPGLYVADASLFPNSSEVNPYLTIMGLADRVAEAVRNDLTA